MHGRSWRRMGWARRGSLIAALGAMGCSGPSTNEMDASTMDASTMDASTMDAPAPVDAGCRPVAHGSCNETSRCYDFIGRYWNSNDPRNDCSMGTYSECGCPSADAIGSCAIFAGLLNEQEVWYYEGNAAELEAECGRDGGTWTPGPAALRDAGPPPADAGPDGGPGMDAGTDAGPPACPSGTVTFMDSCPITPCGGALDGRYCHAQLCITPRELLGDSLFSILCAGSIPVRSPSGSVQGDIAFDASNGTYSRDMTASFQVTLELPSGPCSQNGNCAAVQTSAAAALASHGSVACTNRDAQSCDCMYTYARTIETSGTFSTAGTTLNLSGQTHDYCAVADGDGGPLGLLFRSSSTPRTEIGLSLAAF